MNRTSTSNAASPRISELTFSRDAAAASTRRVRESARRRAQVMVQWLKLLIAIGVEAPPSSVHVRSSAER